MTGLRDDHRNDDHRGDGHRNDGQPRDARAAPSVQLAAELLGHLEPPTVPAELADPAFLEGIYAHAASRLEAGLGDLAARSLTPMTAPADVCWREVSDDEKVREQVADAFAGKPGRAPGLLWTRIRGRVRLPERRRLRRRETALRLIRRAAAALLLGAGLLGLARTFSAHDGTPEAHGIVSALDPVFREDRGLRFDDRFFGGR